MLDSVICKCEILVDNLVYCAPVRIPNGDLEAVYVGPSGAFVIAQGNLDPGSVYLFLRDYLGTTRVDVYHGEKGRYNASGKLTQDYLSSQELDNAIYHHTTQGPVVWTDDALKNIQRKIRVLDGMNRGAYCDDENNWYIARGKRFFLCSDHDPNQILRMSLYGGVLGLHRFAIGKWVTGFIYLLTGGLLGFGWLLDILQIHNGSFKDQKKRLIPKPAHLRPVLYLTGICCSVLLFCLYSVLLALLTGVFDQTLPAASGYMDPDRATWIIQLMNAFSVK